MAFGRYRLLCCFLCFIPLTIAKPTKTNHVNSEETNNNSAEKGSQENIMFGNQQNKPAGMVDDILSFPEQKKPIENSSSAESSDEENHLADDYEYEARDDERPDRLPSVSPNDLFDYPTYDDDDEGATFRKKRRSLPISFRNEIQDLISGKQKHRLRMKRQSDILNWLKNLGSDDYTRYYTDENEEEKEEEKEPIAIPYFVLEDNEGNPLVEKPGGEFEIVPAWKKIDQSIFVPSRQEFQYVYTPDDIIMLPSNKAAWVMQNDRKMIPSIQRRRPLTVNEESNEDIHDDNFYDFLGLHDGDYPQDL